jgi:hypothetical protein
MVRVEIPAATKLSSTENGIVACVTMIARFAEAGTMLAICERTPGPTTTLYERSPSSTRTTC